MCTNSREKRKIENKINFLRDRWKNERKKERAEILNYSRRKKKRKKKHRSEKNKGKSEKKTDRIYCVCVCKLGRRKNENFFRLFTTVQNPILRILEVLWDMSVENRDRRK